MVALVGSSFDFCLLDLQMTTAYTNMELKANNCFCATSLDTGYDNKLK